MKTGEVVWHFGLYSSECCTSEIELKKLQVFPSCPACRDRTIWDCVETEASVLSLAAEIGSASAATGITELAAELSSKDYACALENPS